MKFANTALKNSMQLAETLREEVEKMVIIYNQDKQLQVTVSIGLSLVNLMLDNDIEVAINKADNALYKAKKSGKNKVILYSELEKN